MHERGRGRRLVVQAREQAGEALGQAPHDRVREGDGALEAGRPDELDGLVHGRVRRDAVHEGELVGAQAERRAHGRVELAHRPAAERLDRVVERADALHRPVGELLREGAVARVEPLRRAAEGPVGVRTLLEDPLDDPGRDRRAPAHLRRPRRYSSVVMRRRPRVCTSSGSIPPATEGRLRAARAGPARRSGAGPRRAPARRCAARGRGCG